MDELLPSVSGIEPLVHSLLFGGDDWRFQDLNPQFANAEILGSHYAYTHLNISGEGILVGIYADGSSWGIQVDGGSIYKYRCTDVELNFYPLLIRFKSSLVLSSDQAPSTASNAWALVGSTGRWPDMSLATSATTRAAHYSNTLVNITGKGVLLSINNYNAGDSLSIQVDGGTIYEAYLQAGRAPYGFLIPFKTSLRVCSAGTNNRAVYALA